MTESSQHQVVSSLVALKIATYLNARDHAIAKGDGNRIHYFIDADVLGYAIETPSEKRFKVKGEHPHEPATLSLFEEHRESDVHVPAEYQTAEYIFSGKLPAQGGAPLYFSGAHVREALGIQRAITDRSPAPGAGDAPLTHTGDRIVERFSQSVIRARENGFRDGEISRLCRSAARVTRSLFEPALDTHKRLFRSPETLLALQRLSQRWTMGTRIPAYATAAETRPSERVHEWCARLACARRGERYTRLEKGLLAYSIMTDRQRERTLYDARTLVDVIGMNALLPEKEHAVLITGTASVQRAYADWYIKQRRANVQEFYCVRETSQYMPLINLQSVNETFDLKIDSELSARSFRDIVASIDLFLDPRRTEPSFTETLEKYLRLSQHRALSDAALELIYEELDWWFEADTAKAIADRWRLAHENSILIAVPLLGYRRKQHDRLLREALNHAGGDLLTAQRNIIANLELDQMTYALASIGEQVRQELETLRNDPPAGMNSGLKPIRVVLPLLVSLPARQSKLLTVVEDIESAVELARAFAREKSSRKPGAADVISNIVLSMAVSAWAHAKRLAQLGGHLEGGFLKMTAKDPEMLKEFRFLYALGVRFDCASEEEFRQAHTFLSAEASPTRGQPLRRGRALAERGTLQLAAALVALVRARDQNSASWTSLPHDAVTSEPSALIRAALSDLKAGYAALDQEQSGDPQIETVRRRLVLQAAANALCGRVLLHISGGEATPAETAFCKLAAKRVEPHYESGQDLRDISMLNYEAYQYVADPSWAFPGPRGKALMGRYADPELHEDYPVLRRLISGSDIDLARLYRELT